MERGQGAYDKMVYRAVQVENEARRQGRVKNIDSNFLDNILSRDERVTVRNLSTNKVRKFRSHEKPDPISDVEKRFISKALFFLYHHYEKEIIKQDLHLTIYLDKETGYTYAQYKHIYCHENPELSIGHHKAEITITKNVTNVIARPLDHLSKNIDNMLIWYFIVAPIIAYLGIGLTFRKIKIALGEGLNEIKATNYKTRFPITGKYGKEITDVKKQVNEILERMEDIVEANIESLQDVSHEVNTHLTSIKQSVDVIRMYGESKPEFAKERLAAVDNNIERITSIMSALLELAKLNQGAESPSCELINVKETVEQFVQHKRKLHPDFNIITHYDSDEPELFMDREHLILAIKPIIENAVRYSLNIRQIEVHVQEDYCPYDLYISITNYGIPIPEEEIPHLFERHFRGSTGVKQGSGIGLTIAKKVMDLYEGEIKVESKPLKPTTFTLIFPKSNPLCKPAVSNR
ncbi:sensor histidine kinase [Priestia sp. YIM B13551]|uniref:sensor histidine kinase n=1 Tax=Priestia sp. YIM B13551 TaxID=3366306 RepID=UPI00366EECCD